MNNQRRSGILLHPSSLSGKQPIGSLGPEAYAFIDFLLSAGQSVWQILPLGPVGFGHCPYSCYSAFAGNPLLISFEKLVEVGDLTAANLPASSKSTRTVNFNAARQQLEFLRQASEQFHKTNDAKRHQAFQQFCQEQAYWLNDYAFFMAMRDSQKQTGWQDWPIAVRQRQDRALQEWGEKLAEEIGWHKYCQFVFFEQWSALKRYANSNGIQIFGDLPIFVAEDSADVWANQELFHLDADNRPTLVSGVPPDYFSKTGQRWGNPLYNWEQMAEDDFSWWQARFGWNFKLFDLLRVDHFRGFSACWTIPAAEKTAIKGTWQPVPGEQLFNLLQQRFGSLPIIAEDLGVITPEVEELRDKFEFPGMKILQFAFDSGPQNPYLPHNHQRNSIVYTGTHDNDTTLGWWNTVPAKGQQQVRNYLKRNCRDMPWPLIETALASVAKLAILPLQDILELDSKARLNRPGIAQGNWGWRVSPEDLTIKRAERLLELTRLYGRQLCIPAESSD